MKTTIILLTLTISLISVNCLAFSSEEDFLLAMQECGYETREDWQRSSGIDCIDTNSMENCPENGIEVLGIGCMNITIEEFNKQYEEVIE